MKSFAVKEMWKFSLLQLNEMFCYGKKESLYPAFVFTFF